MNTIIEICFTKYVCKGHKHKVWKIKPISLDSLTHNHHTQEYVQSQDPKQHYDHIHLSLDILWF